MAAGMTREGIAHNTSSLFLGRGLKKELFAPMPTHGNDAICKVPESSRIFPFLNLIFSSGGSRQILLTSCKGETAKKKKNEG